MWPYINIGNTQIYMTWLGMVIWFLTFIISVFFHTQKYKTSFKDFFNSLPLLIVLMYTIGTYFFLLIEHGTFLPSRDTIVLVFSPYWYNFHFVWVLLAVVIYFIFFLRRVRWNLQQKVWMDSFFYSIMIAVIPLGIFLVLGDDFIGTTTQWALGIQAFTDQSRLSKYSAVMPVWLFVSFAWILSLIMIELIKKRYKKPWIWYLWFAVFSFMLSVVFLFQQYPKHGVAKFFWLTVDIKQYICWIIMILCIYIFIYTGKKSQSTPIVY